MIKSEIKQAVNEAIKELNAEGVGVSHSFDNEKIYFVIPGEIKLFMSFGTFLYGEHTIDSVKKHVSNYIKTSCDKESLEHIKHFESIKDVVFPFLRVENVFDLSSYSEDIPLDKISEGLTRESPVPGTSIYYVIDFQDMMMYITIDLLKDWGLSLEELDRIAMMNLKKKYGSAVPKVDKKEGATVLMYNLRDGFDATRLLITDYKKIKKKLGTQDVAVLVPKRDLLIFVPLFTAGEGLANYARNAYLADRYPVCQHVLQWNGKAFNKMYGG